MRHHIDHFLSQWLLPLGLCLLGVLVRFVFSNNRLTVLGLCRGVLVGIFVGSVVNLYLVNLPDLPPETRGAIVGVAAILAEDIILFLLHLGAELRQNPNDVVRFFLRIKK